MMNRHLLPRWLALAALPALVALAATPVHGTAKVATPVYGTAAATPAVAVEGKKTTWQVGLLSIRSMYQIPGTTWRGYKSNFYRFFVLTLRLANTGSQALAPADDLTLMMKVRPPYLPHQMGYSAGFTISDRTDKGLVALMQTAARTYGGVLPWTVARPGQSLIYSYLIGTNRGDSHYGLYNFRVRKTPQYLFDTGM